MQSSTKAQSIPLLSLLPILLPLLLAPPPTQGEGGQPPHIVVIMADDLGWRDVGYRDPEVSTPNIDHLAAEGVTFNFSYMMKSCSPSRSSFLTGLYAFRMGMQDESLSATANDSLPLDKRFFAQDLQDAGYSTHYVGKWHLGFCKPEMTPTYRGFDSFYGMYNGRADHVTHLSKKDGYDMQDNRGRGPDRNFSTDWSAKGVYSSTLFTDKAVDVINSHDVTRPLFLFLSYQAVHGPLQVPEHYVTQFCANVTSGGDTRKQHCGMMAAMDEGIGKVMAALRSRGLSDNLVTLFTSDNGGSVDMGSSNWPLRGAKITEWEGGTRVVSILHSKTHLPAAPYTWNGLMHAVDWYPTLLRVAGIENARSELDGLDNWHGIVSNGDSRRTEFVYNLNEVKHNYGLRWMQYKLLNLAKPKPDGWYAPPAGEKERKAPSGKRGQYMLFNIEQDPVEQNDLAGTEGYEEIVHNMTATLEFYKTQLVPTRAKVKIGVPRNGAWTTDWC